jgi:hypothetical protein
MVIFNINSLYNDFLNKILTLLKKNVIFMKINSLCLTNPKVGKIKNKEKIYYKKWQGLLILMIEKV